MKYVSLLILLFVIRISALSQTDHPKKTYVDSLGHYYQQASLPVYLYVTTSPDEKPIPLSAVSRKEVTMEGHGVHTFKHENIATKELDEFQINADGLAPITISTFSQAPEFVSNGKQYYGKGLVVSLKSKDEMSGLEATYHDINGQGFVKYSVPSFSKEGDFVYSYYAVDNTGNTEKVKTKPFTIDLTAPTSFHNFISISSENVISSNSTIYLTISDNSSGVAKTFYRFDKEAFKPYVGGNIPFQYLADGEHTLTYFSSDNVANKENEKSFQFYLDKTARLCQPMCWVINLSWATEFIFQVVPS